MPVEERTPPRTSTDTALVARGGAINLLGHVIGVLDPLFMVLVSRMLGAGVLGSYILATTYVAMLQRLGVIGLDSGLLRHVPIADSAPDREAALASVVGTAFRITVALSLLGALGAFAFADLIVAAGGDDAQGDGGWWLAWMVLALPGRALSQLLLFALRGRSKMAAFVLVNHVVLPGLVLALALPPLLFGFGEEALVVAYVAASYVGAAVSYFLFRRTFSALTLRAMAKARHDRALVSFSVPQGMTDLLNFFLARVDILMIAAFFPGEPELVAVYAVASLLAGLVKKVRQAFDTSFAPVFSNLLIRQEAGELQALYARVARWIYALFLLVTGPITLGAPLLLASFGPQYVAYWLVVPLLAAGRLLNAAGGPSQVALLMSGRSRLEFVNNLAINALNVVLNLLLIRQFGVYGAALATAASLTVFNAVRIEEVRRLVRVVPDKLDVLKVTAAGAVAAVPGIALLASGTNLLWTSGAAGVLFVGAYPVALYALGLREDVRGAWGAVQGWWAARRSRGVTA